MENEKETLLAEPDYRSYPAPNGEANWVIHEYPSGRKVLIEVDPVTGKETFLKAL